MNPSPRMNQSRRIVAIVPNAHINGMDDNCTVYYDDGTYQEWQVGKPLYLLEQYAKRMALLNHKDLEHPFLLPESKKYGYCLCNRDVFIRVACNPTGCDKDGLKYGFFSLYDIQGLYPTSRDGPVEIGFAHFTVPVMWQSEAVKKAVQKGKDHFSVVLKKSEDVPIYLMGRDPHYIMHHRLAGLDPFTLIAVHDNLDGGGQERLNSFLNAVSPMKNQILDRMKKSGRSPEEFNALCLEEAQKRKDKLDAYRKDRGLEPLPYPPNLPVPQTEKAQDMEKAGLVGGSESIRTIVEQYAAAIAYWKKKAKVEEQEKIRYMKLLADEKKVSADALLNQVTSYEIPSSPDEFEEYPL